MFCQNCGKELSKESKFCKFCGRQVATTLEVGKQPSEVPVPAPIPVPEPGKKESFNGWLILVLIGLFIAAAVQGYSAIDSLNLLTSDSIEVFNNSRSELYMPDLVNLITVEMLVQAGSALAAVYLIYLFFKRSLKFPKYYIWLLILLVVWGIIDYLFVAALAESAHRSLQTVVDESLKEASTQIGRALIAALIWVPYMLNSKKVKAVFVE